MKLGIDIGSTTIKCVLLDDSGQLVYDDYQRHYSKINEALLKQLAKINQQFNIDKIYVAVAGSAGMGYCDSINLPFVQEVYATKLAVEEYLDDTDVVIELGGEDAKILFLSNGLEVRMNGSCAGGTGAFIDQMGTLLNVTPLELNELAKNYQKIYQIASRCGVFAKSDIQPLLNQGAKIEDLAASIFKAIVNQTVAGLAQGREITGKIVYLGGPLSFLSELRKSFDDSLKTQGINPENSLYFVALGSALAADKEYVFNDLYQMVNNYVNKNEFRSTTALFENAEDYQSFKERHAAAKVNSTQNYEYSGNCYLGIDAGSTTVKMVVIDETEEIIFSKYQVNQGNPVAIIKDYLKEFYDQYPHAIVMGSCVTGYGEEMIKEAFSLDMGIVETVAHFKGACKFDPEVDFIIDIGGQDIKCFKIVDGVIDDIYLNEACSAGCGSFLQSFASVLGYSLEEFAQMAIVAKNPVDLGSRCTVFMNSNIKQAQKDGATVEDISAGLAISVVKNALYKVIRLTDASSIGSNIVVQGGTFYNDAVLRSFELEVKQNVTRPNISGMMGAYGSALHSKQQNLKISSTINKTELLNLKQQVTLSKCGACGNNCQLTINNFGDGRRYIAGNKCDLPVTKTKPDESLNMFKYKLELLDSYKDKFNSSENTKGTIGIPMILNFYELLPFWSKFFAMLGYNIKVTGHSTHELYQKGQHTIPSDTVCYPAKLVHGHIEELLASSDVDIIYYPAMTYNFDERVSDNHYNCPVVAYYPEVIGANVKRIKEKVFIKEYIGIHRRKDLPNKLKEILSKYLSNIKKRDIKKALDAAFEEHDNFLANIRETGQKIIKEARKQKKQIMVLAGRPYHLDPEINHGIDTLISQLKVAIITEDTISHLVDSVQTTVLNQWTYHSRLYAAAKYIGDYDDLHLVQLVSFGCGIDSITTDEIRRILALKDKIYTQLKIDEIANLGAVKIRLRSLLSALKEQKQQKKKNNRIEATMKLKIIKDEINGNN
ncbi:MAG: acyl-CoA dehydratase activase [Erysipelotrichaceae bacterium]